MSEEKLKAEEETKLLAQPAIDVAARERLIAWLDTVREFTVNIFTALSPASVYTDKGMDVTLVGTAPGVELPRGLFLVEMPHVDIDVKYRDPLAQAFVRMCKTPDDVSLDVLTLKVNVPRPSAHEKLGSMMYLRRFIKENENTPDAEWTKQLN